MQFPFDAVKGTVEIELKYDCNTTGESIVVRAGYYTDQKPQTFLSGVAIGNPSELYGLLDGLKQKGLIDDLTYQKKHGELDRIVREAGDQNRHLRTIQPCK